MDDDDLELRPNLIGCLMTFAIFVAGFLTGFFVGSFSGWYW